MTDGEKDTYRTIEIRAALTSRSYKAWIICLAIASVWMAAIISPAVFTALGMQAAAESVFSFFGWTCHQMPDRSFHWLGHQLGVCSRCIGIYGGLLAAIVFYPLFKQVDDIEPFPRFWLLASLIPIGIDWSLTFFGIWENTPWSRFITGTILGFACGIYIVPAAVEIAQNTYRPPKPSKIAV